MRINAARLATSLCCFSYLSYAWLLFGPGGNGLKHVIFGLHMASLLLTVAAALTAMFQKKASGVLILLAIGPLVYLQFFS